MAGLRRISYLWKEPDAAGNYSTAVSLHSHTNQSKETLDFLANLGNQYPLLRPILARSERKSRERHQLPVNYAAAYWTPPLTPRIAFDVESGQIEKKLGLMPLVSITDHDTIAAPMLLRTVAAARHIPVSVEWSAPFGGDQAFHFGIHNLPSDSGAAWMKTFAEYTAKPDEKRLTEILAALHALPNVLIVFNHPMWDLYLIGADKAVQRVQDFLGANHEFMHAFELNGLRPWEENRSVKRLAQQWNKRRPRALQSSFTKFATKTAATCSSCPSMRSPGSTASCNRLSMPSAITPISRWVRAPGMSASGIPTTMAWFARCASFGRMVRRLAG